MRFGIDASRRHLASLAVFLVPHPAAGTQDSAINCRCKDAVSPGENEGNQATSEAANLGGRVSGTAFRRRSKVRREG